MNLVVTPFLQSVTSNSFTTNDDGDGFWCNHNQRLVKSLGKINLFEYEKDLEKSNIIITHQRLSTSGHTIEYVHPFENKDFVLVHNGIINQFQRKDGSDTRGFFKSFTEEFKGNRKSHTTREERILKAIRNLFVKDEGSYSIFILDKITNKGYYFKNYAPNIHFYRIKNSIYITTSLTNKKLLSLLTKEIIELEIKEHIIYRIEDADNKVKVIDLGNIRNEKEKKEQKQVWKGKNNCQQEKLFEFKPSQEKCDLCGNDVGSTTYFAYSQRYCSKCWEDISAYTPKQKSL
jgi:glucosamine 6-phosphate synthetase-like amidotransferase/phosphosugar isomerase protein